MLRAGGMVWMRAFRTGLIRCERKGEQTRDLLERRGFERKRTEIALQIASRFVGSWQEVSRVPVCVRSRTGRYPADIAVVAIMANHLLALIGDMGTHGGQPF
jgi:hypothetical protein